jgi:hypothetical protein
MKALLIIAGAIIVLFATYRVTRKYFYDKGFTEGLLAAQEKYMKIIKDINDSEPFIGTCESKWQKDAMRSQVVIGIKPLKSMPYKNHYK